MNPHFRDYSSISCQMDRTKTGFSHFSVNSAQEERNGRLGRTLKGSSDSQVAKVLPRRSNTF